MKGFTTAAVSILLLAIAAGSISCSSECTGEISSGGKTWTATSKNAEDAKRFTCNKYCLDTDPQCEAMYGIWLTSAKGKAAGSPPKMRALSEDKKLLDCVTIKCANKCLADAEAGKVPLKVDCK